MAHSVINAKKIVAKAINVVDGQLILDWAFTKYGAHGILSPDGYVFCQSPQQHIVLNKGMQTLKRQCNLQEEPLRLPASGQMPHNFLAQYCSENLDELTLAGFKLEYLKSLQKEALTQAKYKQMVTAVRENTALGAVMNGMANPYQLNQVITLENAMKEKENNDVFVARNLAPGANYALLYKAAVGAGQRSVNIGRAVYIHYSPEEAHKAIRKKHYYIYSCTSGYGKSTSFAAMERDLNAVSVYDCNNFCNVRENAQFLLVDEYGPNKQLSLEQLKGLTGGKAVFAGNKKTFGASYQPDPNVQVIIASNQHLYEIYGKYDPKTQRRYIQPDVKDTLDQRFNIIKLDAAHGDEKTHSRQFMHPTQLTNDELMVQIGYMFDKVTTMFEDDNNKYGNRCASKHHFEVAMQMAMKKAQKFFQVGRPEMPACAIAELINFYYYDKYGDSNYKPNTEDADYKRDTDCKEFVAKIKKPMCKSAWQLLMEELERLIQQEKSNLTPQEHKLAHC